MQSLVGAQVFCRGSQLSRRLCWPLDQTMTASDAPICKSTAELGWHGFTTMGSHFNKGPLAKNKHMEQALMFARRLLGSCIVGCLMSLKSQPLAQFYIVACLQIVLHLVPHISDIVLSVLLSPTSSPYSPQHHPPDHPESDTEDDVEDHGDEVGTTSRTGGSHRGHSRRK